MSELLPLSVARYLALSAGAGYPPPYAGGIEGATAFIRRVGYVQIDTISVVARAHEHALWSRAGRFSETPFSDLEGANSETEPRRVLEYWAHAAAYIPIEEYRFSLPRMDRIRRDGHEWFRAERKIAEEVLARIRAEGPLCSKDFEDPREKSDGWWDWKPAKRALEYLFQSGELLVSTRKGFNKVFDLAERVLPPGIETRMPNKAEAAARYVDRAIDSYGIFAREDIAYGRKDLLEGIDAELDARVETGELRTFLIEGLGEKPHYATEAAVNTATQEDRETIPRAFILSPFDPFIIDRKRARRLFDFEYSIECYLPQTKRRFGYFALPILITGASAGDGFVGLMDAKADRKKKVLIVKRLTLGQGAGCHEIRGRGTADLARTIGKSLIDYARFNGAERIDFERLECPTETVEKALRRVIAAKGF